MSVPTIPMPHYRTIEWKSLRIDELYTYTFLKVLQVTLVRTKSFKVLRYIAQSDSVLLLAWITNLRGDCAHILFDLLYTG